MPPDARVVVVVEGVVTVADDDDVVSAGVDVAVVEVDEDLR